MLTLDPSPPSAEAFVAGMELGSSVDFISGDMLKSAIDPATIAPQDVVGNKTGTQYNLRLIENLHEINVSDVFRRDGSVTFAGGDIGASVKVFDFSHSPASTGYSILIVLQCEMYGRSTRISNDAKFTEIANFLANHPSVFRERFGDYYVHEISREARFTAVWKCTSQSESSLMQFKNSIGAKLDVQASGKVEEQVNTVARETNVSVEVQYDVLGDMGSAHIDVNASVTENLARFTDHCIPVPSSVYLRHYCNIESKIPRSIEMDPDFYFRTLKAFDDIRLALLLNTSLPGDEISKIGRRQKIEELFRVIYTKRSNYSTNPQDLSDVLNFLAGLLEELRQILSCHELIAGLRKVSYDDAIRGHRIDYTDDTAAWVRGQRNIRTFSVGKTNPSAEEIKKYGIEHISQGPGMETSQVHAILSVSGSLEFPGGTGVHGTVIGFTVNDHWADGTNGWWGIVPKTAPLGKKDLKVSVKSENLRGMHWGLDVWYIPTHLYNA